MDNHPPAQARQRAARARRGFTLIEIMAVVLIMGLLASIVGVAVIGQIDSARVNTIAGQCQRYQLYEISPRNTNGRTASGRSATSDM